MMGAEMGYGSWVRKAARWGGLWSWRQGRQQGDGYEVCKAGKGSRGMRGGAQGRGGGACGEFGVGVMAVDGRERTSW